MKSVKSLGFVTVALFVTIVAYSHRTSIHADGAAFLGSSKCKLCHKKVYDPWSKTKHAQVKPEEGDTPGNKYRKSTGYNPASGTASEPGVTCEACHGPGGDHIKNRASIVNPQKLDAGKAAMICGQCHAAGKSKSGQDFPEGFVPGSDLAQVFTVEAVAEHTANSTYSEWVASKHAANGVNCQKCHDPHGASAQPFQLRSPVNELCGGCHAGQKDIKAHQPTAPADATCSGCHMPKGIHKFDKASAVK